MLNFYWETTPGGLSTSSGGSSTALFGVMGALFMYILFNRKIFPKGYILIPLSGFMGAVVLFFFEDGHSPLFIGGWTAGFNTTQKKQTY